MMDPDKLALRASAGTCSVAPVAPIVRAKRMATIGKPTIRAFCAKLFAKPAIFERSAASDESGALNHHTPSKAIPIRKRIRKRIAKTKPL